MKYARGNCRYTLDKKMGGRISKELELQRRRDDEKYARDVLLDGEYLILNEDSISWIVNHIDCFVCQSRGNVSVQQVNLRPHAFNDDIWGKLGQAIGNLQSLKRLRISTTMARQPALVMRA
jgi:hypothetical protein